mgnify:CR=1 FL=1
MSVMGKNIYMWRDGAFQSIEFVVTQECNMRCKYCYMIGKNDKNRLSIETAKKAIDYILSDDMLFEQDALAINFIGGEPLLEIELIDQICDYFKIKMYEKNHKWFNLFMINIGSNGLLYDSPKVQKFLQKNKGKVSLNITIDGTKEKHDLQRVYPNGEGTHADVLRNVKLWLKQAPLAMTKVTIGHDDMDYLKDSIIYLWNIGMNEVPANIVFEDVWKEGDDIRYYTQLRELADYVVDNHLWDKYNTTLFSERLGLPLSKIDLSGRECGSGGMITIDASGRFYPCVRFMDYSLENQESISIGDSENGLNFEKIRAFVNCDLAHQSDKECLNCTVASECSYCLAHNYDISGTLFRRNKHICKMHKARVRANNYYWARLENALGKKNVFNGLNINITSNELVAIVGANGSGKTTFMNLLMGFYKPKSGEILFDNLNSLEMDLVTLRENITYVQQYPFLFNDTVKNNLLAVKENATEDELVKVCKDVCLYDTIIKMPKGFDTVIGDGGTKLSGGQRQLLSIARGLLRNTKIFLLDEITSNIDGLTERNIVQTVFRLSQNHTVIMATHRATTIMQMPRIIVICDGKNVAEGTHEKLLNECMTYKELFKKIDSN